MSHRFLTSAGGLAVVAAVALLAPAPVAGQSGPSAAKTTAAATTWTPPRTADGQPDLQGVWDYRTVTPLERPLALGTKKFFTDEEAANYEKDENRRQNRDLIDPEQGGALYPAGGVVPYNEFCYDRGNKIVGTKRTSLIVDPPNGQASCLDAGGEEESGPPRRGVAPGSGWTSPRRLVGRPTSGGALPDGVKRRTANHSRPLQQQYSAVPDS
jgi:hypothetical protein